MRTLCDICEAAPARLFCAADEAALCVKCDEKVWLWLPTYLTDCLNVTSLVQWARVCEQLIELLSGSTSLNKSMLKCKYSWRVARVLLSPSYASVRHGILCLAICKACSGKVCFCWRWHRLLLAYRLQWILCLCPWYVFDTKELFSL